MARPAITGGQRARVAAALRDDLSNAEAAKSAGISVRSVQNLKSDPHFRALVEQRMLVTAGHAPGHHAVGGATDLLAGEPSRTWISVPDREVLGSVLHPLANLEITDNRDPDSARPGALTAEVAASVVQVALVSKPARIAAIREALQDGRTPLEARNERTVPLTLHGLLACQCDPEKLDSLIAAARPDGFEAFLSHWRFLDQDTGRERILGENLWPAQREFIKAAKGGRWMFVLKARQLGETTIAGGFDGWALRFRDSNARVHVFSRRDDESVEILERVAYGLDGLPSWLQLPLIRVTGHRREYCAGSADVRVLKAYPSDAATSRGATCSHAHIDEFAVMGDPRAVWRSVEPGAAGSIHVITTSLGPENFAGQFWMRAMEGEVLDHSGRPMRPVFVGALARPDRDELWLEATRRGTDAAHFALEYPTRWEDALAGSGETFFNAEDVRHANVDYRLPGPAQPGHKYVKAVDVGTVDPTVITVLDITESPMHDVVHYVRLKGTTYTQIGTEVERVHRQYPGPTWIEDNAAGAAVREHLNLPAHEVQGFKTTQASKGKMLAGLAFALESQHIKWSPEFEQLTNEMLSYRLPDDSIVQDSVVSLAIAEQCAGQAHLSVGRILAVLQV